MEATSVDLRKRIVEAYDRGEGTQQELATRFSVSYGLVKKLVRQWKQTGSLERLPHPGGPKKITAEHEKRLAEMIEEDPGLTLEALRDRIGVDCTPQAVHYALGRMGITFKKNAEGQRTGARGRGRGPQGMGEPAE